jgi:hypothetical protein
LSPPPSQHPVDQLIRELIQTGRPATKDEVEAIIERMATASFEPRVTSVPVPERGITYDGYRLGARVPSLAYHLVKRIVLDRQWADGTTEEQYLEDLRRAARAPTARFVIYEHRGGHVAITLTPTSVVVPQTARP